MRTPNPRFSFGGIGTPSLPLPNTLWLERIPPHGVTTSDDGRRSHLRERASHPCRAILGSSSASESHVLREVEGYVLFGGKLPDPHCLPPPLIKPTAVNSNVDVAHWHLTCGSNGIRANPTPATRIDGCSERVSGPGYPNFRPCTATLRVLLRCRVRALSGCRSSTRQSLRQRNPCPSQPRLEG